MGIEYHTITKVKCDRCGRTLDQKEVYLTLEHCGYLTNFGSISSHKIILCKECAKNFNQFIGNINYAIHIKEDENKYICTLK